MLKAFVHWRDESCLAPGEPFWCIVLPYLLIKVFLLNLGNLALLLPAQRPIVAVVHAHAQLAH